MNEGHPAQDPAHILKPLHPRAARPALERILAQGQIQAVESDTLAQIYLTALAEEGPELPAEAISLVQRFVHQPSEREMILSRLLKLLGRKA